MITMASEIQSVIGDFSLPSLNISRSVHLFSSCEPLGLLVEEPEISGPEEAVEEAKEDGDVAFAELGARAMAIDHLSHWPKQQNQQARTSPARQ